MSTNPGKISRFIRTKSEHAATQK